MERPQGVHFEIEEGNRRRPVVRGLRRRMNDQVRTQLSHEFQHALAVANVDGVVAVSRDFGAQPLEHPTRIAFGPEEDRPVVAVDPRHAESLARKEHRHLRTDQTARAGH